MPIANWKVVSAYIFGRLLLMPISVGSCLSTNLLVTEEEEEEEEEEQEKEVFVAHCGLSVHGF